MKMAKRDPYKSQEKWKAWKNQNGKSIPGISRNNSNLILLFLNDMEIGMNVSPYAKKGQRSYIRLLALKSRLISIARRFQNRDMDRLTKDEIHQFFFDMREGIIVKENGKRYLSIGDFVKDFKTFWGWLKRIDKVSEDITVDLRRSDGRKPDWLYFTEEQFKKLANQAQGDYRALMWFMYDTGARVTEAYSVQVKDFSNDFTRVNIRKEYSKTFGRVINLKLCTSLIKEYVIHHDLGPDDFLFIKKPAAFNKYLRTLSGKIFGDGESPARKHYNKMTLYDIRHNACCYWLKRYPRTTSLMYRMGWSEEKEVRYYSEFLGMADQIDDEDMVTSQDKSIYEKRIQALETEKEKTNELIKELIIKITALQTYIPQQRVR